MWVKGERNLEPVYFRVRYRLQSSTSDRIPGRSSMSGAASPERDFQVRSDIPSEAEETPTGTRDSNSSGGHPWRGDGAEVT